MEIVTAPHNSPGPCKLHSNYEQTLRTKQNLILSPKLTCVTEYSARFWVHANLIPADGYANTTPLVFFTPQCAKLEPNVTRYLNVGNGLFFWPPLLQDCPTVALKSRTSAAAYLERVFLLTEKLADIFLVNHHSYLIKLRFAATLFCSYAKICTMARRK